MANFPFPQRLKLRHKLAALGVVGMALLLLPLVQLLRWHGLELQWAQSAQNQLAPALLAVELQSGLVDHRQAAAQVLQGQAQAEAARREHQAVVDARLAMLGHRLQSGAFATSLRELAEMRADWMVLVQRIVSGSSSVAHSNHAHRLLIEQTLQIIDNLSVGHTDGAPLQHAAVGAQRLLAAHPDQLQQAVALLAAAQNHIEHSQAAAQALHQGHRALAASALLALLALMVGLCCWVVATSRRASAQSVRRADTACTHTQPPAPAHPPWQAATGDSQHASRLARLGLMQRLRARPAPPRNADRPTQPHDL